MNNLFWEKLDKGITQPWTKELFLMQWVISKFCFIPRMHFFAFCFIRLHSLHSVLWECIERILINHFYSCPLALCICKVEIPPQTFIPILFILIYFFFIVFLAHGLGRLGDMEAILSLRKHEEAARLIALRHELRHQLQPSLSHELRHTLQPSLHNALGIRWWLNRNFVRLSKNILALIVPF